MRLLLLLALSSSGCLSVTLPRAPLPAVNADVQSTGRYAGGVCLDAPNYEMLRAKLAILTREAGR